MNPPKRKSLIYTLVVTTLVISGVLYLLADRYLIEHVEIANVNASSAEVAQGLSSIATVPAQSPVAQLPTEQPAGTTATETVSADDWNYQSENVTIAIRQVTTGSGQNQLTYYVADVTLADATQLSSAFAKNSFGRNIIEYTSQIAEEQQAIFAINGDYYGFRSDGIVIRNGVIYRDVPARTGLAFYRDGTMSIYDETQTSAQALLDEGVWNTLSFGPALIEDRVVTDDTSSVNVDRNFGNHSIQGDNPRTGVGIIDANHFVFVVVDGRSPGYSRGVDLAEFARIFADLGCSDAYNIDGGGSSTMYFMGRVVNNPLGKNRERGTSDILYVGS